MRAGDIVGRRFRIVREAAHGGMGTVYRADDLEAGGPVAVKVMRRTDALDNAVATGRFAREIAVLASLDDPRVVRYIAHGTLDDGRPFLAEEWIDGTSLADQLDAEGLTVGASAAVVAEIAAGLAVAHARGIVHRDVKPANVLFVGGDLGRVKVIDFGIARRSGDEVQLTRTGTVVGTPGYISPEQARGAVDLDARSDVFALGCILYECLTGRPAFAGRSLTAVRSKVLLYHPPAPDQLIPHVVPDLSALVGRMLAKNPDDRPPDGAAVAAALARFTGLAGEPPEPSGRAITVPGFATRPTVDTRDTGLVACVVIADTMVATIDESALQAAVARHGGKVELLAGGTVVVCPSPLDDTADQVVHGARCALALRPLVVGPIVLCAAGGGHGLDEALEEGSSALSEQTTRTSGDPDHAVRVDRGFATLLRDHGFRVVHGADGHTYLSAGG
jgi:hypothetical protein